VRGWWEEEEERLLLIPAVVMRLPMPRAAAAAVVARFMVKIGLAVSAEEALQPPIVPEQERMMTVVVQADGRRHNSMYVDDVPESDRAARRCGVAQLRRNQ